MCTHILQKRKVRSQGHPTGKGGFKPQAGHRELGRPGGPEEPPPLGPHCTCVTECPQKWTHSEVPHPPKLVSPHLRPSPSRASVDLGERMGNRARRGTGSQVCQTPRSCRLPTGPTPAAEPHISLKSRREGRRVPGAGGLAQALSSGALGWGTEG